MLTPEIPPITVINYHGLTGRTRTIYVATWAEVLTRIPSDKFSTVNVAVRKHVMFGNPVTVTIDTE